MKTYEAVLILDDKKLDDHGETFCKEVADQVKKLGGRVKERHSLGRKQFAAPIKKRSAGTYWNLVIDMDPANLKALEDRYRLNAAVLRLVILHYDPAAASASRQRRSQRRSRR